MADLELFKSEPINFYRFMRSFTNIWTILKPTTEDRKIAGN